MSDEELYKSFIEALKNLTFEVPMLKAIEVPTYKKFLRDILSRRRAIPPVETVALIESYPVGDKYRKKHEDPGTPVITCHIGGTEIQNALCDLGAGVSVMPLSLYEKLKLGDYSPTSITLQMVDKNQKATCRNDRGCSSKDR